MDPSNRRFPHSPEEVEALVDPVPGWLGPHEGRLLYELAAAADPAGCIVEIGSWHGRSTTWLAAGALSGRGAPVVAVDPHTGTSLRAPGESTESALRDTLALAGVADNVEVLVQTSEEAAARWSRPVSLLFVDGDHEYESARRDLELWEPFLRPDAAVAVHDTFVTDGPERAVREFLVRSGRYTGFRQAETTTAARRYAHRSLRAELERRLLLLRRRLYGARLRAYDRNRLGYARLRDRLGRR